MTENSLHDSVGQGGRNLVGDVVAVQRLLLAHHVSPGGVDGRCGRHTLHAIDVFQNRFLKHPDGRVDPGGTTWRHLIALDHPAQHPVGTSLPTHAKAPPASHTAHVPTVAGSPKTPEARKFWTATTELPHHGAVNIGLHSPHNTTQLAKFGKPAEYITKTCKQDFAPRLAKHMVHENVGPFRVTGFDAAVVSLHAT